MPTFISQQKTINLENTNMNSTQHQTQDSKVSCIIYLSIACLFFLCALTKYTCIRLHHLQLHLQLTQRDAVACVCVPWHAQAVYKSVHLPVWVDKGWSYAVHTVDWGRSNLVWHIWRLSDNRHDCTTDRGGNIDLKSSSSMNGPEATGYIWTELCEVIKDLTKETCTTPAA